MNTVANNEYPERAHMSTISDLLGIQHFTTSAGATVRKDFLVAVAVALGSSSNVASLTKDQLLGLVWESAWGKPMPRELLSRGGTVTNAALESIIEGIVYNQRDPSLNNNDDIDSRNPNNGAGPAPDFGNLKDTRRRRVAKQAIRDGQNAFRDKVLNAYGYRCAVTHYNTPAVLEAAHIAPYQGAESNDIRNGLCLRSDIHSLFDRYMFTIDERSFTIILSPALQVSDYAKIAGTRLRVPSTTADQPDRDALRSHRLESGLALSS